MIYCSQCGTQNRDGSKFCSNCAARLAPPSGLICPMCSTANPVETVFCNNCGARLVPLTGGPDVSRRDQSPPIKGLSLPAKAPPTPSEEEEEEPVTKEKIEDWLAKLRASPPTEDAETLPPENQTSAPVPPPTASESTSSWVKELPTEDRAPETETPLESRPRQDAEPSSLETREEVPDWLKELGAETRLPEAAAEPEPEQPASTYEAPPVSEELPDWLKAEIEETPVSAELRAPEPIPLEREEEQPAAPPEEREPEPIEPAKPEEIPSWVAELKPPEEEIAAPEPIAQDQVDTQEISDWLRTPTTILEPAAIAPENLGADVEIEGPLANLRGVLPVAMAMAEPHTVAPLTRAERTDGAHLFDEILAPPAVETARATRRRVRRGFVSMRAIIYLFLALAASVPFFLPLNVSGSALQITGTRAAEFFDTIRSLPSDSTVLVSFDYDPTVAGEMDLLASAIVRHLVQRRVKIVALSTLETGPFIAQRILVSATSSSNDYRYGVQYLNLGFLPGHESGLLQLANQGLPLNGRDFGQNQVIGQYPIVANVKTAGSFAMVIELAGTEEPLKNWLEQFQPQVHTQVAAAASAAVEPKARAYRDAKQLKALIAGSVGAAQYEILANQQGTAVSRITAQSLAQIVLIAAVVIGNIVFWISRFRESEN